MIEIGVDIVQIDRINRICENDELSFIRKILTTTEQNIYHDIKSKIKKVEYISGRFSAKESIVKSLGVGIGEHISWHDMEVINNDKGKPSIIFSKRAKNFLRLNFVKYVNLSISHEKKYVVSMAVANFIK